MKKIFFITPDLQYGGAQHALVRISNEIYKNNDVSIICLRDSSFEEIYCNCPIIRINQKSYYDILSYIKLIKILIKNKPNTVISFMYLANNISRLIKIIIKFKFDFKLITSERTAFFDSPWKSGIKKKISFFIDKSLQKFDDVTTFNNKMCINDFKNKRYRSNNFFYIPNFIEYYDVPIINKLPIFCCYVGRLEKEKGVDDFLNHIYEIYIKDKLLLNNFKFHFFGMGSLYSHLDNQIKKYKIQNKVKLIGNINHQNLMNILKNYQVGINYSKFEGMSNSLLEYGSLGMDIIANDIEGNRNTLNIKEIFYVKNQEDIHKSLKTILDNQILRFKRREKIKQFVDKKFSKNIILKKWNEII